MEVTRTFEQTRSLYRGTVGLLPTLGYFHEGHLRLMDLLRARCDEDGASVIIATHNAAHAAWADRVVHLRDGVLVQRATAVTSGPFGVRRGADEPTAQLSEEPA